MRKITQKNLNEILELHKLWLLDNTKGKKANLSFTDLSNTDLSNTDLSNSDLKFTNLIYANLKRANLSNSNLNNAYLNNANLGFTDLSNTDLRNTILINTDLSFAKNILLFQKPNGRICYAVKHTNCIMIQAGCFWGTIDEFEQDGIKKYGDDIKQNYQPQVQYLKSIF